MLQEEEFRDMPFFRRALDHTATWIATGGYSGFAGFVPGTVGSLVGLALYTPLAFTFTTPVCLLATVIFFFLGVFAGSRAERIWRVKDPQPVVIDEIVGMWISLLLIPPETIYFLAAFVLFRIFDVVKPFPARQAELLPGGWGIMLDDLFSGIYANAAVHSILIARQFINL